MAAISNNNIAEAIYGAIKGKTRAEQSEIFPQIVQFLFRKRLLSKAPDILMRLNNIINEDEGIVLAKVSSAEKINEHTKKEISHALSKRYSGKKVNIIENLDEKLLGGFKIEVNDEVIDLTLKNRIGKLEAYLNKA